MTSDGSCFEWLPIANQYLWFYNITLRSIVIINPALKEKVSLLHMLKLLCTVLLAIINWYSQFSIVTLRSISIKKIVVRECFVQFTIILFLWRRQKLKDRSLLSLQKKRKLLPAQFSVKFIMLPGWINRSGKLIYLHVCLHKRDRAGLIEKSDFVLKWNSM